MKKENKAPQFKPVSWLKCEAGLNPVEHFFSQESPVPISQKMGYCRLCWDEQLRINGYRKPNLGHLKEMYVSNRTEAKPEKDSL